ncbi:HNH endonuclease [Caloramator proteoclasticus]|uniref:Putative HNH nuclease YajD n=1 Tax=Caloramator proteoclasticus DSM 10124 TaxID=1121262 RepID=A0A1M5BP31_9CLOT|nr:HNH endonuclease signature motif containing protein [Caloramator proteoclasticus]SHF44191.1 5-methylcytosine-specific restriction enzyme A [Caloramator proteoclasticus DSM 10124]
MPRKPKRPCSYPGCPELTDGRYCERHEKEMTREYNRNNRTYKYLYNSTRWKRLRIKFLKENPLCAECGKKGIVRPAEVVDHIIPHKGNKELFWDESNLQALCKECHDRKTAKEDGRWGRKGEVYKY